MSLGPPTRKTSPPHSDASQTTNSSVRQWSNLLVLSAAYKDPILNQFISETTLRGLFSNTISFFELAAHSTSALSIDMRILQRLKRELFDQSGSLPSNGLTRLPPTRPSQTLCTTAIHTKGSETDGGSCIPQPPAWMVAQFRDDEDDHSQLPL